MGEAKSHFAQAASNLANIMEASAVKHLSDIKANITGSNLPIPGGGPSINGIFAAAGGVVTLPLLGITQLSFNDVKEAVTLEPKAPSPGR